MRHHIHIKLLVTRHDVPVAPFDENLRLWCILLIVIWFHNVTVLSNKNKMKFLAILFSAAAAGIIKV